MSSSAEVSIFAEMTKKCPDSGCHKRKGKGTPILWSLETKC